MDRSDYSCRICLGILYEPCTLPCNHTFCKECFERSIEHNNLACPMCKKRISIWHRKASRAGGSGIVDRDLWNKIQAAFPEMVREKRAGLDDDPDLVEDLFPCLPIHQFAEEGSIGKEFQNQMKNMRDEMNADRENEAASFCMENGDEDIGVASPEVIQSQKEALLRYQQIRADEELARKTQMAQNSSSPSSSTRSQKAATSARKGGGGKIKTPKDRYKQTKLTDLFSSK